MRATLKYCSCNYLRTRNILPANSKSTHLFMLWLVDILLQYILIYAFILDASTEVPIRSFRAVHHARLLKQTKITCCVNEASAIKSCFCHSVKSKTKRRRNSHHHLLPLLLLEDCVDTSISTRLHFKDMGSRIATFNARCHRCRSHSHPRSNQ